jgi:syntaxin-binding protein 5
VTFTLPRRASIRILQFCANRLISVDSKNEVIVWDLQEARKIASYAPPGAVTALVTDHMLDWAFIGLQNGGVIVYDLDRERPAPLKLPNFWQERSPRSHMLSVVSMQLHPKDIGQLLIGYTEGAIIYSFKQNRPIKYFQYEIPPGAPGGNSDPTGINEIRRPRLTQVLWHPSGTFLATAHEDSSLVFWDLADGRVLMSRTLQDTRVNQPTGRGVSSPTRGTFSFKESYKRIAWCCKDNPDDTGLLIAGGFSAPSPDAGLTFIDLGPTPVYATSSWQVLSSHFEGKKKHILPTPHGVELVDFCLIPRTTPHFAGAHDPIAAICLLSSGELITLSFPSGHPISPTNQLHPSLFFVHPFVTSFAVSAVERGRWLGMTETRNAGPRICQGGAEAAHPLRRYEARNIVQVANGDGTVRIWDAGHEDEIENPTALQIDVARAVARFSDVDITKMSMGDATGEFAVGTKAGEVVIYRWGGNKLYGRESARPLDIKPGDVVDIADRTEPTLKEGLQPFVLYNMAQGPITALKMSDVGFVGVGSAGGMFSIIDLRGPAVIYSAAVSDFIKAEKQSSFIKKAPRVQTGKADWPVAIEFGVMTVDGDDYSSILCFVGTDAGYVATFKILPQSSGRYTAELAGSSLCNGSVVSLSPIKESGKPASASGMVVAGLREGQQVIGTLVVGE